jgi:DNA uptake protein ComE-like DNA-binding protein
MPGADVALTVMLREWTPTGYLTRDYRNITVAATKPATEVAVVPVVDALPVVEAAPEIKVIATIEAAPTEKNKDVTDLPKESVKQKSTKKAGKTPSTSKKISVNTASEEELMAVKGLPTSVARAIVAARPFAALDDVCRAKGIGAKLLAKLRDRLAL